MVKIFRIFGKIIIMALATMKKVELEAPMRDTVTMNYAHPNENTARMYSLMKAKEELNRRAGKEVPHKIISQKMYRTKDGKYEGETVITQQD